MVITLNAKARDTKESLEHLRKNGEMPAVFYGAKKESTPITINTRDFTKIWKEAGESSAIKLAVGTENIDIMIHDIQIDPMTGAPVHADFLAIDMNKPIEVAVQLSFSEETPAVTRGIGILVKVIHEIEVRALPKDLPHEIEVDTSGLENLDDQILVKDLKLPAGVEALKEGDEVVALITAMKEEKEEEAAPVDLSAIEVEQKGKKDEEEGEAAAE